MAITPLHVGFLLSLRANNPALRNAHSLMDIGEQNWFYSSFADTMQVVRSLGIEVPPEPEGNVISAGAVDSFATAKLFYRHFLGVMDYEAIDLHGTKMAKRVDLNHPYSPQRQFDVVQNFGTTEHVFNQFEAFNTIHKLCRAGGFMIHALPHSGGREHGFFNYHATFFFDLAAANRYEIVSFMWTGQKTKDGRAIDLARTFETRGAYLDFIAERGVGSESFFVCFKKASNGPFACPMQGYYDAEAASGEEKAQLEAFWKANR